MRLYGNAITVPATFERMDLHKGCFHLTVRNNLGNHVVYFSHDGTTTIGFILAGESKTWHLMSPNNVFIKGTAGETVFWDGDGQ